MIYILMLFIKRVAEGQGEEESALVLVLERLSSPAALILVTVPSLLHLFVLFVCSPPGNCSFLAALLKLIHVYIEKEKVGKGQ